MFGFEKLMKCVKWGGSKATFMYWQTSFASYVFGVYGKDGADLLQGLKYVSKSQYLAASAVIETNRTKEQVNAIKWYRLNSMIYRDLILSIDVGTVQGQTAFDDVWYFAKTDTLPDGDAAAAWRALEETNMPKTSYERSRLEALFANTNLKDMHQNPERLIYLLKLFASRINRCEVPNMPRYFGTQVVQHLCNPGVLPIEYENVTSEVLDQFARGDASATPEWMRRKLVAVWM